MNVADFIQNYRQVENETLSLTPNLLARAFVPITFRNLGFNTEIKSEESSHLLSIKNDKDFI